MCNFTFFIIEVVKITALGPFGYYKRIGGPNGRLVYIVPKRVESMEALRDYVTRGWDVYKYDGYYYTNAVNETESTSSDDQPSTSSGGLSSEDIPNGNGTLGDGFIETVPDNPKNVVEVSDEDPFDETKSEAELDLYLSDESDIPENYVSVVGLNRKRQANPDASTSEESEF